MRNEEAGAEEPRDVQAACAVDEGEERVDAVQKEGDGVEERARCHHAGALA